jgi:hypothetical protein
MKELQDALERPQSRLKIQARRSGLIGYSDARTTARFNHEKQPKSATEPETDS